MIVKGMYLLLNGNITLTVNFIFIIPRYRFILIRLVVP